MEGGDGGVLLTTLSSLHLGEPDGVRRSIPRLKPEDTLETEDGSVSEDDRHPQVHANGSNCHGINSAAFSPGYFERWVREGTIYLRRH